MLVSRLQEGANEEDQVTSMSLREDGGRCHVHFQYIKIMKNEDGGVQCRRWMKT
jgi:hypothetical protein